MDTLFEEVLLLIIGPITVFLEGVWLNMLEVKSTEGVSNINSYMCLKLAT